MIEQLARTSAEELRAGITSDVDAGLADLYARQARHRRRAGLIAAAAVALAVGVGVGAGTLLAHRGDPAPTPSHQPQSQGYVRYPCQVNRVTCLEERRAYRFDLVQPVEWRLPPHFRLAIDIGVSPREVRGSTAQDQAGVRVLEQVRASSPDGDRAAPGVADDPKAFVDWVASRPFLQAGPVTRVEVDDHQAWQVQATVAPDAGPGRKLCGGVHCFLLTYQPDKSNGGITPAMASEFTAFRLPGAGTTVVWSWTFTGDTRDLAGLDDAVAGLSWPSD